MLKDQIKIIISKTKASLLIIICSIVFLIGLGIYSIQTIPNLQIKLKTTNTEIKELTTKRERLTLYSGYNLDLITEYLNKILPLQEDGFSIYNSITSLTKNSGGLLENMPSFFQKNTTKNASIQMQLAGNLNVITKLLTDYQYKSGRFILIPKLSYAPSKNTISFTTIYFTSQKTREKNINSLLLDKDSLNEVLRNAQKYNSLIKIDDTTTLNLNYETNKYPFQQFDVTKEESAVKKSYTGFFLKTA